MPNRRSAINSLNTSSVFVVTVTTCRRSPTGSGEDTLKRLEGPLRRRGTTSERQGANVNVFATRRGDDIMEQITTVIEPTREKSPELDQLIERYGCGPVQFTGTEDALYERHLVFDNVLEAAEIGARERFEAVARSVRDVLSQRWIRTEETYHRNDPKRVYYLSMEFLIGRSLANNVTNLLLDDATKKVLNEQRVDWYELLEQEPDAGLGNGGLGRLAACF